MLKSKAIVPLATEQEVEKVEYAWVNADNDALDEIDLTKVEWKDDKTVEEFEEGVELTTALDDNNEKYSLMLRTTTTTGVEDITKSDAFEIKANNNSGSGTEPGTGTGTETEPGTEPGTETGTETEPEPETETGTGTGTKTGTATETEKNIN